MNDTEIYIGKRLIDNSLPGHSGICVYYDIENKMIMLKTDTGNDLVWRSLSYFTEKEPTPEKKPISSCQHEYVNISFLHTSMACKYCGADQ